MPDTPNLTWQRTATGARVVAGLPVRLSKWKDTAGVVWVVQVPIEADPNMLDGWVWADAWTNDKPGDGYPERMEAGTRITQAMQYVVEHLEQILAYAAKQRSGWPLTEGTPLGQYISRYLPDGGRLYDVDEQDAPAPGEALVVSPGQPPRQVQVDHVTDDDVRERLAGVQPPSLDPYELAGLRTPNANGWPATIQLSSVQFEALLEISGKVGDRLPSEVPPVDVSKHTRALREIHTQLTNADPRGR